MGHLTLATDPTKYSSILSTDFNFKSSYLHQYSLNVQKDLRGNVLTVAYVGNLGERLVPNGVNVNQRPYAGAPFPIPSLPNVTIHERKSNLKSNYNALQLSVQRRLTKGLAVNANYTLAHSLSNAQVIDEGQPVGNCVGACHVDDGTGKAVVYNCYSQYDYGNADLDTRHRVAITMTYKLPYGAQLHGVEGVLAKGWSVNSIYYAQTGNPFTVQNSNGSLSGISLGSDRPNMVPSTQTGFHQSLTQWFDVTRFQKQGVGLLGNEHRNQIYGPGSQALSLSLFKSFQLHEATELQFRAESFNLLNTPTFSNPSSTITSYDATGRGVPLVSAGQISSTAGGSAPRQLQFALKLLF